MQKHQEKALTRVAGFVDSGWKIGSVVVLLLGAFASMVLAWNLIFETADGLDSEKDSRKKAVKEVYQYLEKEFKLRDARSDKRYKRAMSVATEIKEVVKHHDEEIEQLKEDQAYEKGRMDMYLEMEKRYSK